MPLIDRKGYFNLYSDSKPDKVTIISKRDHVMVCEVSFGPRDGGVEAQARQGAT